MKDKRISFVEQPSNWVIDIPSPDKYDKVPFDKYARRSAQVKIHTTHLPRFKPIIRNAKPAPTTYNTDEAINKSQWISTKYSVGKDKTSRCHFDKIAKSNKSPGPGTHLKVE